MHVPVRTLTLLVIISVGALCRLAVPGTNAAQPRAVQHKVGVSDQVTFLYYDDLAEPRRFYGTLLGMAAYYETPWVTLYRSAPSATIGIVKRPKDPLTAETKRDAVMVSIVTNDVESWYRDLKRGGRVKIQKELYDHPTVPIRAFQISDPAGYSIEFFQWRKP